MEPRKKLDLDLFNLYHVEAVSNYIGFPQVGVILLKIKENHLHKRDSNGSENIEIFEDIYLDLGCSVSNLHSVKNRLNTKRMFTHLVNYLDCATVVDNSWVSVAIIAKNCFRRFNNEEEANHE